MRQDGANGILTRNAVWCVSVGPASFTERLLRGCRQAVATASPPIDGSHTWHSAVDALPGQLVEHHVGFARQSFGACASMVPVAATLFTRSAGAHFAAAAHVARDSVGAVFFQGAVDLHALWTRGHRLGQCDEADKKQHGAQSGLHGRVRRRPLRCLRLRRDVLISSAAFLRRL